LCIKLGLSLHNQTSRFASNLLPSSGENIVKTIHVHASVRSAVSLKCEYNYTSVDYMSHLQLVNNGQFDPYDVGSLALWTARTTKPSANSTLSQRNILPNTVLPHVRVPHSCCRVKHRVILTEHVVVSELLNTPTTIKTFFTHQK
jgi:hypothetical protein